MLFLPIFNRIEPIDADLRRSLRYYMQLVDELGIYYLIIQISLIIHGASKMLTRIGISWALFVSWMLFVVPKDTAEHEFVRATMSISFTVLFVYVFYGLSKGASEVEGIWLRNGATATAARETGESAETLFKLSFGAFVFSILAWLVDNAYCGLLRSTFDRPPPLHALWHVGTACGMYGLWCVLVAMRWSSSTANVKMSFWPIPHMVRRVKQK